MYAAHFGLKTQPFSIAPDPHYLYRSERHHEALAHLTYGIEQGNGFVLLTGEVGTGKTTVCRCLLDTLPSHVEVALILNPRLTEQELVATLCDELHIAYPPDASLKVLMDGLNHYLLAAHGEGKKVVLMVDEAQTLSPAVLEHIRLLTNLETNQQKLLQIILVGQPELRDMIQQPALRQLSQRITARYHLTALTPAETQAYIQHRLQRSGAHSPIFTRWAMRRVYHWSSGIPRLINVLCDRALLGAYAQHQIQVNGTIVNRAAQEVLPPAHEFQVWRRGGRVLLLTALVGSLAILTRYYPWQVPWQVEQEAAHSPALPITPLPIAPAPTPVSAIDPVLLPSPAATAREITAYWPQMTLPAALSSLLQPWAPAPEWVAFTAVAELCRTLPQSGLNCWHSTGTWQKLRQLNTPVMITLQVERQLYYATVTRLSGNQVVLQAGPMQWQGSTQQLEPYWLGDFLLLWRSLMSEQTPLSQGQVHAAVIGLRQQLGLALGQTVTIPPVEPQRFDAELKQQVMAFQQQHGLTPDGIVGPQTLLALGLQQPGHPTLQP